jgi:small subunit ribosomal protein S11
MNGKIIIRSCFSNTFISLVDLNHGNTLCSLSAGRVAERSKRATYFAGISCGIALAKQIQADFNVQHVHIVIKGIGPGRDAAIRGLKIAGLKIKSIQDQTKNPHNGCRPPKKRRI